MSGNFYSSNISGKNVLLVWNEEGGSLEEIIQEFKKKYDAIENLQLEHIDRVKLANHANSTFDVVVSNVQKPYTHEHSLEVLAELLRVLKPSGKFIFRVTVNTALSGGDMRSEADILSALKLSGWVDLEVLNVELSETEQNEIKAAINGTTQFKVIEVVAKKPNYEVGASSLLTFKKAVPASVAAVWKLEDTMEDDLIDEDELLGEEDLKKPDPASLRVCGTTGKRKACRDCSCGLADELASEGAASGDNIPAVKTSSCGSCYLGDAFRCSTCPYLGMPAFKPGEKIQLSDTQLKADA